ncbi:hypothetical protein Q9S36_51090, partial [Microbacterium sp. ARD31]
MPVAIANCPARAGSVLPEPTLRATRKTAMLKTAFVAARDRQRLSEIASVLIGFGLTKVVDRLGLHNIPL